MAKTSVVDTPIILPEPAVGGRWPGRVRYKSPTLIGRLRLPPSGPVDNMDGDENDGLGPARGFIFGALIGSSMWGAIGSIVCLLLDR